MRYELRDCTTGEIDESRKTTVDISVEKGVATFVFTCKNCQYYCPYRGYNDIHSVGDAVEILIGTDKNRKVYYEIELSPLNGQMLAQMTYKGEEDGGKKILLDIDFVKESFVKSSVLIQENGYVATLQFPLEKIYSGEGEVYFNAYRLDTDGGKLSCYKDEQLLFALNPTGRPKFHTPDKFLMLKDYVG